MKKWAYPLLIAFVAFFIFSSPGRAGSQGRSFVIWVGDLAGAAGEFLDGLFDETGDDDNTNFVPDTSGGDGTDSGADNGNGAGTSAEPDDGNGDSGDQFDTLAALTTS